jgi:hypothetical protein
MTDDPQSFGPLAGLRVLDIATIFAAALLADFGADVVKFEMPGQGDGLRSFLPCRDGKPLWWKVTNRGKRHATLDLRRPAVSGARGDYRDRCLPCRWRDLSQRLRFRHCVTPGQQSGAAFTIHLENTTSSVVYS